MKHKISLPRRAAAFALAFLLVLPNAYAAAGEQKLQTSTQIAPSTTTPSGTPLDMLKKSVFTPPTTW